MSVTNWVFCLTWWEREVGCTSLWSVGYFGRAVPDLCQSKLWMLSGDQCLRMMLSGSGSALGCSFRCLIQAGWLKQAKTVTWALGANLLGIVTLMDVFWGEEGTSWVTMREEKEEEGNSWEKRGVTAQKVLAYSWCQFHLACCVQAGLLLTFQGVKEN